MGAVKLGHLYMRPLIGGLLALTIIALGLSAYVQARTAPDQVTSEGSQETDKTVPEQSSCTRGTVVNDQGVNDLVWLARTHCSAGDVVTLLGNPDFVKIVSSLVCDKSKRVSDVHEPDGIGVTCSYARNYTETPSPEQVPPATEYRDYGRKPDPDAACVVSTVSNKIDRSEYVSYVVKACDRGDVIGLHGHNRYADEAGMLLCDGTRGTVYRDGAFYCYFTGHINGAADQVGWLHP